MKNRLERFVRDNREAFDDYEPSNDLWKKIEPQTAKNKPLVSKKIWFNEVKWSISMAASVIFIVSIAYFVYRYNKPISQNADIVALSPSYAKELMQFSSLVESKRNELKALEKEDPQLYHQFDAEHAMLEKSYQTLKQELPKNPNQEELLKAMIQNLTMQIDLLNQQLQIIHKIKETKNGKATILV